MLILSFIGRAGFLKGIGLSLFLSCVLGVSIVAMAESSLDIPSVPAVGAGQLDCFAKKVRAGEPVVIGYIGGSITQGTGASTFGKNYYYLSSRKLLAESQKIGGSNVEVKQAAVGGTDSVYGANRVGIQLLNAGLDLLIIEFAVNDRDDDDAVRGMEAIVRHAWRVNPKMAIVFLYTTTASAVKDFYMNGKAMPSVLRHHQVAKHYGIAEVHCGPVVAAGIKQGLYTSKEFFRDGVHPSDIGHEVYAELLVNALCPILDWKNSTTSPRSLPDPIMNDDLAYAQWTSAEPIEKIGNWVKTKPGYYTYVSGWTATSAASMKFPVKGKKITLVFGKSNAKFRVSGLGFEKEFTGIKQSPPWVPKGICIYAGSVQKEGIVTITVEPATSGETMFNLVGIISECKE